MSNRTTAPALTSATSRIWAIRAVATLMGLLVGLALAELMLWAADLPRVHHGHQNSLQCTTNLLPSGTARFYNLCGADQELIYEDNPRGYFGTRNEVSHVTNASGFRGDEFIVKKSPGAFRAVFLGDSFTFGEGVRFSDTYPEVTRAKLQTNTSTSDVPIDCFNLGVVGSNTSNEKWCLETVGWKLDPDLVVLGYVLNDSEVSSTWTGPTEGDSRYALHRPDVNLYGSLFELIVAQPPDHSIYRMRTARMAWKTWNMRSGTEELIRLYHKMYDDNNAGWQESRDALQGILDECHEHNVPCIVVLFPVLYRLQNYPFTEIHAKVRDAVGDRAIFIDLLSCCKDKQAENLWVHSTDQHPNEIVHAIAAEQLVAEISRLRLHASGEVNLDRGGAP